MPSSHIFDGNDSCVLQAQRALQSNSVVALNLDEDKDRMGNNRKKAVGETGCDRHSALTAPVERPFRVLPEYSVGNGDQQSAEFGAIGIARRNLTMMKRHSLRRPYRSALFFKTVVVTMMVLSMLAARAASSDGEIQRTAIVSAFAPEIAILKSELENPSVKVANGVEFSTGKIEGQEVVLFLSGISVVNAAMTVQLALDHFPIKRIVFSGIAGGVDPSLNIGDVIIADRWGQYLETVFARKADGNWAPIPFFEYPYENFGMMFPRAVTVRRKGDAQVETRFWFPVDERLLAVARSVADNIVLARCAANNRCIETKPKVVVGGSGVSGGSFIDNSEFRTYAFETFGARALDMESAAVAHVAYANQVPFLAVRSLADLAGGGAGENQMEEFMHLAARNSTAVVKALLRQLPK